MLNFNISFFLFLAFSLPIFAQSGDLTQLKNKLSRTQSDSLKVDLLNKLSFASISQNIDSVYQLTNQAKSIATSIGYDAGLARTMNLEAMIMITKNNYHKSIGVNNKALRLALDSKSDKVIAQIYTSIGFAHFNLMEYDKSLDAFLKSDFFSRKTNDEQPFSAVLINIINCYIELEDYTQAEQYLEDLEQLGKSLNDDIILNHVNYKFGDIAYRQEDYKTALKHYWQATQGSVSNQSYSNKKAKQEIIKLLVKHSKQEESKIYLAKVTLN